MTLNFVSILIEYPTGSVQPQPGKTSCTKCAAGFFQDLSGKTVCKQCPVNFESRLEGAVSKDMLDDNVHIKIFISLRCHYY